MCPHPYEISKESDRWPLPRLLPVSVVISRKVGITYQTSKQRNIVALMSDEPCDMT